MVSAIAVVFQCEGTSVGGETKRVGEVCCTYADMIFVFWRESLSFSSLDVAFMKYPNVYAVVDIVMCFNSSYV